jgi:hypothetical protein
MSTSPSKALLLASGSCGTRKPMRRPSMSLGFVRAKRHRPSKMLRALAS